MRWPPYKHIFFDCDSTLTTVEGIDILADAVGKKWRVEVLTRAAMDGDLDLEEVYEKRLRAVKPTRQQVREIRRAYKRHIVEDAVEVIAALQALGHQVYIISGGLAEPVAEFGVYLGVPSENIRAVTVDYDQLAGNWWDTRPDQIIDGEARYMTFDESGLTVSDGKAEIVKEFMAGRNGRSLLIGDGISDLLAGRAVDLFVGYGGVSARSRVQANAPAFISTPSLAPLLALASGPHILRTLNDTPHQPIAEKSLHLIETGAITFQNERLKNKFDKAVNASYQTIHPWTDRSST